MALDIRNGTTLLAPPLIAELAKTNRPGTLILTSGLELPFDRVDVGSEPDCILWRDETRTSVRLNCVAAVRED